MAKQSASADAVTMELIQGGGHSDSISLDHGNLTISYSDPGAIARGGEAMVVSYHDEALTAGEEGMGHVMEEDTEFSEVIAGEQLLQMANAIAAAHERQEAQNMEVITTTDQHQNIEVIDIAKTMTELQPDGSSQVIPVSLSKVQDQQVVELVPVTGEDGKQVYVQVTKSLKEVEGVDSSEQVTDHAQEVSGIAEITEIVSGMEGNEVVIDGLPLQYQNYENFRTEVLEDGSIRLFVVDQKSNSANDETHVQRTSIQEHDYIIEQDLESTTNSGAHEAMMTVTAKKIRDVATQITVFPKFSRAGLFDVSTQVGVKDLSLSPRKRALANGTTVIQNSIKTQNESTVILNAGEGEIIFFKCNICGKVYKNKQNWQNHIKLHAQEKVYMCGHCGKIYQKGSLSTHLRTHSELRQIAVFENLPKDLKRKNYKHVPGSVFLSEEASVIELNIGDVATELDPVLFPPASLEVVEKADEAVIEVEVSAPLDIEEQEAASNIVEHVENNVDISSSPHVAQSDDAVVEETEVYTESDIPAKMHMEVEAEMEMQEGTKTRFIYKCNICGKEYNNKSNCHRHLKSHTETKGYKCGICGKAFTHRYEVKMHCRTHTGERPFKCPICTRGFNESGNLRRHMKIHQKDDLPLKCGVCFKGFSDSMRLNAHTKVHTGDIVCDVCGRKFSKISDLYRHIKIHTGDRPYKCEVCGKTFVQKVNLTTHQRTHTGQKAFRCDLCGIGFSRKITLETHMKTHKDDQEYPVERTAVPMVKSSQVKVMEAEVIEHMEALSQEYTVTDHKYKNMKVGKGKKKKPINLAQTIILADGQEIVIEDGNDEDED